MSLSTTPVSVFLLENELKKLPSGAKVCVNEVGNLSVLDAANNYIGWIDQDGYHKVEW